MAHARRRGSGHPLLTGMSIGLLLGLALALALAVYLYSANPFSRNAKEAVPKAPARVEPPKPPPFGMPTGELPPAPPPVQSRTAPFEPPRDAGETLRGPAPERAGREAPTALSRPVYLLQAGSFQRAEDADNLKAQLALTGLEATIVKATVADRGVWHRVRIGPFADQGSLQSARALLRDHRIESTVITMTAEQLRDSAQDASRP